MKINTYFLLLAAILLTIVSCKKEEEPEELPYEDFILIGNEGQWQANNGSITAYNPDTKEVIANAFKAVNDYDLGDIVQSMMEYDGNVYICVAGSGKIEVINRNTFKIANGVQGIANPRYMFPISPSKAYVSSWEFGGASEIAIVNLLNNTKSGSIQTGRIEKMVFQGDNIWAAGIDTDKVFLIDVEEDLIEDQIDVNYAPESLIKDKDDYVWVLSWGKKDWMDTTFTNEAGSIARINPTTKTIEKTIAFPDASQIAQSLTIDPDLRTLYFIYGGDAYSMDIGATTFPSAPFENLSQDLYAVGVRGNNEVYVTEAGSFTSNGTVHIFNGTQLVDSFTAGIGPSSFNF